MPQSPQKPLWCRAMRRCAQLLSLWIVVICVACSQPSGSVPVGDDAENIRQLAVCYMRFIAEHGGRGPKNEKRFTEFMAKIGHDPEMVQQLLVSPRDGKPYEIRYDISTSGAAPEMIAYEQDGVEGVRYVAFDFGGVEIADEEQFRDLLGDAP